MTEGINPAPVTEWLVQAVPDVKPPFEFSLISGGHSNLTFKCTDSNGYALVLRRPPLGHVLESAHDMGREQRIITGLAETNVPVAPNFGLCTDPEVNGAPFYVMVHVDGIVPHDSVAASDIPLADRPGIGEQIMDILANLHDINPDDVGLGQLGRKEAYIERQLKRWNKQWEASKTHEIPEMDESARLLAERMPEQIGSAIVHGDYRLGNMIVGDGQVLAVLDWELCTLGDPLADVAYFLNWWNSADDVEPGPGDQSPSAAGGFPSRQEMTERYQSRTGRDLSNINYYRAFSHWRLASIGQGVYKRYLVGAMGEDRDVDLERQKEGVSIRARAALEFLSLN